MRGHLRNLVESWLITGLVLVVLGCASIMTGTKQDISISSVPSGAKVKIERLGTERSKLVEWEGTTPATVKLKRKYEYLVTISKEGYRTAEVMLEQSTNGWVWGNLVFGGIIGVIVDFSSGAANKLKPGEIRVTLVMSSNSLGETALYAVLQGMDDNGKLHVLPVRLVPEKSGADR